MPTRLTKSDAAQEISGKKFGELVAATAAAAAAAASQEAAAPPSAAVTAHGVAEGAEGAEGAARETGTGKRRYDSLPSVVTWRRVASHRRTGVGAEAGGGVECRVVEGDGEEREEAPQPRDESEEGCGWRRKVRAEVREETMTAVASRQGGEDGASVGPAGVDLQEETEGEAVMMSCREEEEEKKERKTAAIEGDGSKAREEEERQEEAMEVARREKERKVEERREEEERKMARQAAEREEKERQEKEEQERAGQAAQREKKERQEKEEWERARQAAQREKKERQEQEEQERAGQAAEREEKERQEKEMREAEREEQTRQEVETNQQGQQMAPGAPAEAGEEAPAMPSCPEAADANALLRAATEEGDVEGLIVALGMGADTSSTGGLARSALHLAAIHGHGSIVEVLVDLGVDINVGDVDGMTPLHLAAFYGHALVAVTLVERGADLVAVSSEDMGALTPAEVAIEGGHRGTAKVLLDLLRVLRDAKYGRVRSPTPPALESPLLDSPHGGSVGGRERDSRRTPQIF